MCGYFSSVQSESSFAWCAARGGFSAEKWSDPEIRYVPFVTHLLVGARGAI
jgi:hypothetical protein